MARCPAYSSPALGATRRRSKDCRIRQAARPRATCADEISRTTLRARPMPRKPLPPTSACCGRRPYVDAATQLRYVEREPGCGEMEHGRLFTRRIDRSVDESTASWEAAQPTLDGLAADGLRYANFHVTPLCSPTCTCLLTGRNHHSVGMGRVAEMVNGSEYGRLRREGSREPRRDAATARLPDPGLGQVAFGVHRRDQPCWALRPLAASTRLRPLLRLPDRRDEPVASGTRPRQRAHRAATRRDFHLGRAVFRKWDDVGGTSQYARPALIR